MKVLVACEFSGVVRDAFRAKGHDAWSCDYDPSLTNGQHIQGDVREILSDKWDLLIAHPPCTYLCNSGVRWLHPKRDYEWWEEIPKDEGLRIEKRWNDLSEAVLFFNVLLQAPIEKICVENPLPHGYANLPPYTQMVQPWMFGDDASKRTCLWLKNLPPLEPTNIIKKKRYANQTPSGQNKLGPSKDRARLRSITYQGIANAMADQWT